MIDDTRQHELDEATRRRLTRLATRPVEVSELAVRLREQIAAQRDADNAPASSFRLRTGWICRGALAAALVIAATVVFVVSQSGSPAYAAPAEMVRLHRDLIAGRAPVIAVASLAEARQTIEMKWRDAPTLPDRWDDNIHACCLRDVQSRQVACILMRQDDTPVTVVVARASDLRSPDGPVIQRNGQTYVVRSSDGVNMVMTQQEDRWMCLMADLPEQVLVDLTEKVAVGDR